MPQPGYPFFYVKDLFCRIKYDTYIYIINNNQNTNNMNTQSTMYILYKMTRNNGAVHTSRKALNIVRRNSVLSFQIAEYHGLLSPAAKIEDIQTYSQHLAAKKERAEIARRENAVRAAGLSSWEEYKEVANEI
jgi:hypothetical protein